MIRFFSKSKTCAKKRLLNCIQADRLTILNTEKIRMEIENILLKYVELEGEVSLNVTVDSKNKRYITAGALIK